MVNELQEKFFCPRLIDYVVVVGSYSPLSKNSPGENQDQGGGRGGEGVNVGEWTKSETGHLSRSASVASPKTRTNRASGKGNSSKKASMCSVGRALTCSTFHTSNSSVSHVQSPDILRRFPEEDHKDFALPKDVVCFCQPEGCITSTSTRAADYNKVSSFVFTISDKDTVRTRYGVCVNFYRPVKQRYSRNNRTRLVTGSIDYSSTSNSGSDKESSKPAAQAYDFDKAASSSGQYSHSIHAHTGPEKRTPKTPRRLRSRKKFRYSTLTSLCLISHHPFFMAFRECLFYLKSLIDVCNDTVTKGPDRHRRRSTIWEVIIQKSKAETPLIRHYIREIEKWILRLLSAPVPVPGKTRVEVELFSPEENRPALQFALPDHTRFPLLDFPIHLPLELLGVESCIQVICLILLEYKVVFQSRDYNALSMSVMAFIALIYPLDYMFPVIPLLPISMDLSECLLDNPTPYVVGVPVNFFVLKKHFTLPDDIWLIDLDANKIISPDKGRAIPPLPQPDGSILKSHLRQAISSLSANIPAFSLPPTSQSSSETQGETTKSPRGSMSEIRERASRESCESINKWIAEQQYSGLCEEIKEMQRKESEIVGSTPNLFVYGNDIDSVDVAVRVAMVRFFNSSNMLANLVEHTRTIRLFPRPVVALQIKSFLQSRNRLSIFIEEFCKTQAVEFFAEWSLTPTNVVFQRIHTSVFDPTLIGDKSKWFAQSLEPITFQVWNKSAASLENAFKQHHSGPNESTDESAVDDSDVDDDFSPASSITDKPSASSPEMERKNISLDDLADAVYQPPLELQIPSAVDVSESPLPSPATSPSTESDLESPQFQPSSIYPSMMHSVSINNDPSRAGFLTESSRGQSICSNQSLSRQTSKGSGQDSFLGLRTLSREKSEDVEGETALTSSRKSSQDGFLAQMDKITIHAKRAAGEATKSVQEVSRNALEASKTAAGVSKSTFEDLTYVGKNTFGDLTKSAKQVASKTSFLKTSLLSEFTPNKNQTRMRKSAASDINRISGKEFLSNISQDINGIAAQTSSMFTDLFGNKNRNLSENEQSNVLRPPVSGEKILAEKSPLIRHSSPKRPEDSPKLGRSDRALNSPENQAFLRDISHQILEGESVSWLKVNRCRKLLEDESNRCLLLNKLNRTLDCKINPSDHVEDIYVSKSTWKSMLKVLQAIIHGLEVSYKSSSSGGLASVFYLLEIAHTHYWCKEGGGDSSTSGFDSQTSSPFGSHENIRTPTSPRDSLSHTPDSRKSSGSSNQGVLHTDNLGGPAWWPTLAISGSLNPLMSECATPMVTTKLTQSSVGDDESITTPVSEVSNTTISEALVDGMQRMSPESGNVSETGSMVTNPAYVLQRMHKNNASFRSTVSDSEIEQNSSRFSRQRLPSAWSSKSSLSAGFRYHAGAIHNTLGLSTPESNRTYIFEGLLNKDRSPLWDTMEFWEEAFIDAVSHERDIVGMDQGPGEMMDRYKHLSENEQRRLAHDEDRLLSTMLYNLAAFMLMMDVRKDLINQKVRSMLGKCRIAICYAEEITSLLCRLTNLHGNDIDLKCVASRLGHGQSFAVHVGIDSTGPLLFIEVRDDGLVMRSMNGVICERWWYERVVNMTYSPKNKVLCLWKKVGGQTSLHKYFTKKSKKLYYCIKSAMERAVALGQHLGQTVELGGEFPVKDIDTGEGGLLQVCIEGVGLLFSGSKAGQICYSVLCVFSYTAAVQHHKRRMSQINASSGSQVEFMSPRNSIVS